jgi:hypothetical protein
MPFGKAISLTRAHTNLLLSDEAAILTGWAACQVWCAQQNTTKIGLVLSNVEDLSGSVASALGSDVVDQLVHHNKFEQDGVTTLLLTEKTTGNETASVLLLLGIPPERLSTMTDHPHVDVCVFIPRTEEDLEAYLRLYPKSAKVELKDVDDSQQPAMTLEHRERVHWYEKHYEVIAHAHLQPGNRQVLGARQLQICRYCSRQHPATTFSKEAHALPLLIGNRTLIDALECDACNAHFGSVIEDHFAKWTHPFRTMGRIEGRRGVPSWKSFDDQSRIEAPNASNLRMWFPSGDSRRLLDEEANFLRLTLDRQPYVPMGVFKSLVKMALAVMPPQEAVHCEHLKHWILDPVHSFESYPYGPLNVYFQQFSGPTPTIGLTYWLMRRHPNSDIAPYLSFALQFSNLMLQIILPIHGQDKSFMNGKNFELGWFPTVAGIANHEDTFGPTVRKVIDMSGTAPVKGDQEPMRFRFESREEILQSDPPDR